MFSLLVAASLGNEGYGIFIEASVIHPLIIAIISNILLVPSNKIVSSYYGKRDFNSLSKVINTLMVFLFLFSLGGSIIYLSITPLIAIIWNRPYILEYMIILTPTIVLTVFSLLFSRMIASLNNYSKLGVEKTLGGVFYIGSVSVMVFIGGGWTVDAMIGGIVLHRLLVTLSSFILFYTELKKQKIPLGLRTDKAYLFELITLGKYFLVSNNLYEFLIKLDLLILPIFFPDSVVGSYSFAKNLIVRFRFLFNRLGGLLYPTFAEIIETTELENVKKFLLRGIYFSLFYIVLFIQIIFMFSREIIWIVSTFLIDITEFLPSAPLMSILCFLLVAEGMRAILDSYFAGFGKVKVILKANLVVFLIGSLLVISFTIFFGILGTAAAMVLVYFGLVFYYLYEVHRREITISKRKFLLRIVGSFIAVGITLFFYNLLVSVNVLPDRIDTILAAITFAFVVLFYIILDFSIISFMDVLTYEELLLIEKIAGKNKAALIVVNIVKRYHGLFNRR